MVGYNGIWRDLAPLTPTIIEFSVDKYVDGTVQKFMLLRRARNGAREIRDKHLKKLGK
jgi:hypothetical protein